MKPGPKPQERPPCCVCGRPSKVIARRLCNRHYARLQRYGRADAPRIKALPWSEREIELLKALPRPTRSGRIRPGDLLQLAEELGRSPNAVRSMAHHLAHGGQLPPLP